MTACRDLDLSLFLFEKCMLQFHFKLGVTFMIDSKGFMKLCEWSSFRISNLYVNM